MACGCSGKCSCLIVAGQGTSVRGQGTATSPYVIDAMGTAVTVQDGNMVDLTLTGLGTTTSPYVIRADYTGNSPFRARAFLSGVGGAVSLAMISEPAIVRAEVATSITDFIMPSWPTNVGGTIRVLLVPQTSGLTFPQHPLGVPIYPTSETGDLTNSALLEFTWDGIDWSYVRIGTVTGV